MKTKTIQWNGVSRKILISRIPLNLQSTVVTATFAVPTVVVLKIQVFWYGDVSLSLWTRAFRRFEASACLYLQSLFTFRAHLPSEPIYLLSPFTFRAHLPSEPIYLELVVGLLDPEGEDTAMFQELHIQRYWATYHKTSARSVYCIYALCMVLRTNSCHILSSVDCLMETGRVFLEVRTELGEVLCRLFHGTEG